MLRALSKIEHDNAVRIICQTKKHVASVQFRRMMRPSATLTIITLLLKPKIGTLVTSVLENVRLSFSLSLIHI